MDAKAEVSALADKEKHAREFRIAYGVPDAEWELAEVMAEDFSKSLLDNFWKIWEAENGTTSLHVREVS